MLGRNLNSPEPRQPAQWACLVARLPSHERIKIGILLVDTSKDRLHIRIRPHWWDDLVDSEEGEIWQWLSEDLSYKAGEMGAAALFDWLATCCSHTLEVGAAETIEIGHPDAFLGTLYQEQIIGQKSASSAHKWNAGKTMSTTLRRFHDSARKVVPGSSRGNRWTAPLALAASMVLVAMTTGDHSHSDITRDPKVASVSKSIELPLVSGFHYQDVQLAIPADLPRGVRHARRRKSHVTARIVRTFVIAPRFAKPHDLQLAVAQPPSLSLSHIATVGSPPPYLMSEPQLPEFHPRRKRFIRVLVAMAIPFRFVASR